MIYMNYNRRMKGMEPLIAAVLLIAIALMIAIMIYQWQTSYIHEYADDLKDSTQKKLVCDRADLSFVNISYDCTNNCEAGTGHILEIKLKNYGDVGIGIEKIYLKNTTGSLFEYPGGSLDVGEVKKFANTSTTSCHGINKTLEEILVITDCPNLFLSIPADKINWVNC